VTPNQHTPTVSFEALAWHCLERETQRLLDGRNSERRYVAPRL